MLLLSWLHTPVSEQDRAAHFTKLFHHCVEILFIFLVYQDTELVGNFIRITDTLSEDFDSRDLKRFLAE